MMRHTAIVFIALILAACRSLAPSEQPSNPPSGSATTESAAAAPPAAPATPAPPQATRQFHLGNAATALVAQAHARVAAGDFPAATATLERALRIEPDNPLTWIELGEVQLAAGNAAQADNMAHKALALASGDPNAQASAWRLIAESLRARNRNQEASSASAHADALAPR
jgi:Tfp pilus assembly protein PilF